MVALKHAIVRFEVLGEGLSDIVNLYKVQRSEEVIEDIESEIDCCHFPDEIYEAINDSYLEDHQDEEFN